MRSPLPPAAAPVIELIGVSTTFPTASGERARAIDNIKAMGAVRDPSNRQRLTAKLLVEATRTGTALPRRHRLPAAARARAEALAAARALERGRRRRAPSRMERWRRCCEQRHSAV
jgi:hypothetical protein